MNKISQNYVWFCDAKTYVVKSYFATLKRHGMISCDVNESLNAIQRRNNDDEKSDGIRLRSMSCHRRQLLKLDKQIGGNIYWFFLAMNEAQACGRGRVQHISLVGCKLPPLDGYVAVCLVLTIEVYGTAFNKFQLIQPKLKLAEKIGFL